MKIKKQPLLSIIMPVYNAEKRLNLSIGSILNQNYRNIELIIINDGSSDESYGICCKYQEIDNRVRLYNQENSGVSIARNKGIEMAAGDYITFIDADDTIEYDAYSTSIDFIENNCTDILIFGMTFDYYSGNEYSHSKKFSMKENEYIKLYNNSKLFFELFQNNYLSSSCNKIISRSIIKSNNIRFEKYMAILEDFKFVIDILQSTTRISILPYPYYHYYNIIEDDILKKRPNIDYLKNFKILDIRLTEFAYRMNYNDSTEKDTINDFILNFYYIGIKKIFMNDISYKEKYHEYKKYIEDECFKTRVIDSKPKDKKIKIKKYIIVHINLKLSFILLTMFQLKKNYYNNLFNFNFIQFFKES